MSQRKPRAPL